MNAIDQPKVLDRMLAGFRAFRSTYYEQRPERASSLLHDRQKPEVLLIACSDSRVDPAILMNAEPGELFVVRNVAALVPPCEKDGGYHGTSAAIEFAVRDLKVSQVVVLGHSACGGMKALVACQNGHPLDREFIRPWVSVLGDCTEHKSNPDLVGQNALRCSLNNLRTFSFVKDREESGHLTLNAWWFDMHEGVLWGLDPISDVFHQFT